MSRSALIELKRVLQCEQLLYFLFIYIIYYLLLNCVETNITWIFFFLSIWDRCYICDIYKIQINSGPSLICSLKSTCAIEVHAREAPADWWPPSGSLANSAPQTSSVLYMYIYDSQFWPKRRRETRKNVGPFLDKINLCFVFFFVCGNRHTCIVFFFWYILWGEWSFLRFRTHS